MAKRRHNSWFESACGDLFRNIANASALRRNPLTRGFFSDVAPKETAADELALAEIREQLVAAARSCLAEDLAKGRRRQGLRSFEIVSGLCRLESGKEIAASLRVSLPQFYRDRERACLRAARVFWERRTNRATSSTSYDPMQLQMRRIRSLIDHGLESRALVEGEKMLGHLTSDDAIVAVFTALSRAAFELGDIGAAQRFCGSAQRHLQKHRMTLNQPEFLEGRLRFERLLNSLDATQTRETYATITQLAGEFGNPDPYSPARDELAVEILLELCRTAVIVGNVTEAWDAVKRAGAIDFSRPLASAELRSRIAFMKAYSSDAGSLSSEQRLRLLNEALEISQAAGSSAGALRALMGLVNYWMSLGREAEATVHANAALELALTLGGQSLASAMDSIAGILLPSKEWPMVEEMLLEIGLTVNQPYHAMRHEMFRGQLHARHGEYEKAIIALSHAEEEARAIQHERTLALVLAELALAHDASGRRKEARRYAVDVVTLLERFGSASARRFGYAAAAKVLNDSHLFERVVRIETGL